MASSSWPSGRSDVTFRMSKRMAPMRAQPRGTAVRLLDATSAARRASSRPATTTSKPVVSSSPITNLPHKVPVPPTTRTRVGVAADASGKGLHFRQGMPRKAPVGHHAGFGAAKHRVAVASDTVIDPIAPGARHRIKHGCP
jgi:hypothetical protein